MGLDMYLNKKTYVGNKWRKKSQLVKVSVPKNQKDVTFPTSDIKNERIQNIEEEVMCWRKANAIHAWFVRNVQSGNDDCKEYYVSVEQLVELLDLCTKVISASKLVKGKIANGYTYKNGKEKPNMVDGKYIEDATIAKKVLPVQEGFFFGSTNYDEWYLQDLKDTKKALTEVVHEKGGDFYYNSSW